MLLVAIIHLLARISIASAYRISGTQTPLSYSECRHLPGDVGWPKQDIWDQLNETIGGRLILGAPLGQPCHRPYFDQEKCSQIQEEWKWTVPFEANPITIMAHYWLNNTCSPFTDPDEPCNLGHLAPYAINVSGAEDVIAGIKFARDNNVRLTIKNTGHDFLGRSAGAGSLALWTHNLREISFVHNYESALYAGPAVRVGAGVIFEDLYQEASAHGFRVVGGLCPTVGAAGGFTQHGGYGALTGAYGLGADQVLEWEVVTADGQHLTVSPYQHKDLFWALSGGGAGNFAVTLSMTVRAHADGPVAGAGFTFANSGNDMAYWAAFGTWLQHLPRLNAIKGLSTIWVLTSEHFSLEYATLPDPRTAEDLHNALVPFFKDVEKLNVTLENYRTKVNPNFNKHYLDWAQLQWDTNLTSGSRLIPRWVLGDEYLPELVAAIRSVALDGSSMLGVAADFTRGSGAIANAVLPAWREAAFTLAFEPKLAMDAGWEAIRENQKQINTWQEQLRILTPGGGTYINEATWDSQYWREDYYGPNYEGLLAVKTKFDADHVFWAHAAVGSDEYWKVAPDGRLCHEIAEQGRWTWKKEL